MIPLLVSADLRVRFQETLGPFLTEHLESEPGQVYVSGSIIHDILYQTNFADDIDVFLTPGSAQRLRVKAIDGNCEVTPSEPRKSYVIDSCDRWHIWGTPHALDIVSCENPLRAIRSFDFTHCKVAWDGVNLWTLPDGFPSRTETRVNIYMADAQRLFTAAVTGYKEVRHTYEDEVPRTLGRCIKFAKRGFTIYTRDGFPMVLPSEQVMDKFLVAEHKIVLQQYQARSTLEGGSREPTLAEREEIAELEDDEPDADWSLVEGIENLTV
jgi:hypothetical protein